jgi:hypothetical protein
MSWIIDPVVQIDGVDYSDESLNGVSINYGRSSIWEQPRAGYASIQIINATNSPIAIVLNNPVTITVDNSTGTPVTVFTGKVSSISSSIQSLGAVGTVVVHSITAIGPMADMSRVLTHTSSFPKEYDDIRLNSILTTSGVTIDVVDTPGVYEFAATTPNPNDCYYWASYYAQMAFGYIYETTDGKVGYANESRRTNDANDYGYLDIPTDVILGRSIQSQLNTSNLINDVLLEYKNNQTVTSTSSSSITTYGKRSSDIKTELEQGTQAQTQADRYRALRSTPETLLQNFTVQLNTTAMTNSVRNALLAVYMGLPVQVDHFPNGIFQGIYRGFVEGWNLSISQNSATLSLNVSKFTLSITPTRWQDVLATLQWEDVDPTLEWSDYE